MNLVDFERYIDFVLVDKRNDVINYYYKLMNDSDFNIRIKVLNEWVRWEFVNVKLFGGDFDEIDIKVNSEIVFIENYYFVNNCFFEEGYILNNIYKIKYILVDIIYGVYDLIC